MVYHIYTYPPMFVFSQFTHTRTPSNSHSIYKVCTPNSFSLCTEKCLSIIKFEMKIKVFQVWMLMRLLCMHVTHNVGRKHFSAVPNQSRKNTKTMYKWLSEFTNKMSIKTLKSFQIIVSAGTIFPLTIRMDSYLFCGLWLLFLLLPFAQNEMCHLVAYTLYYFNQHTHSTTYSTPAQPYNCKCFRLYFI